MNEHQNEINFTVPLSGSKLFDSHVYATAKGLCDKFPGLNFDYSDPTRIRIHGTLNDFWHEKFNRAVFEIGEFEAD